MPGVQENNDDRFSFVEISLLLAITISAGACYPAIKRGLVFAPPLLFAGLRTLIGGLMLLGLLVLLGRSVWPDRSYWRLLVPLGFIATTLTFGSMFLSPSYAPVGIASVLGNLQPLIIVVLAAIVLGEKLAMKRLIAVSLGLAGVVVLSVGSWGAGNLHGVHGMTLAVLSSTAGAVASIWVRSLRLGRYLIMVTAWQLVVGSIPLLLVSWVTEQGTSVRWTWEFAGLLGGLALFGTALTTLGWFWLLREHEASRLGVALFFVPVFGLVSGSVIHEEAFQTWDIIGILLVLTGIMTVLIEARAGVRRKTLAGLGEETESLGRS